MRNMWASHYRSPGVYTTLGRDKMLTSSFLFGHHPHCNVVLQRFREHRRRFKSKSRISAPIPSISSTQQRDPKPDVVIVGSGGGGLTAALRAQAVGLIPLVVEKSSRIGGSTCYSGGGLWIPNNGIHPGVQDSVEEALRYMEALIDPTYTGPASTRERKLSYLEAAPKMMHFLQKQGFQWIPTVGYPDYYPQLPGGKAGGRSVEPKVFDVKKLGEWEEKLNFNPLTPSGAMPMYTYEGARLIRAMSTLHGFLKAAEVFGWRRSMQMLLARRPVTMGASLTAQLLWLCLTNGVTIWTNTELKEIKLKDGRSIEAVVNKDGTEITLETHKGLLLGAGGFARNKAMRERYQEHPITDEWTAVSPPEQGDAIIAAMKVGAATDLLDDAWWGPTIVDPRNGTPMFTLFERALPHCIIVDKAGARFTNEAQSYTTFGHDQYHRNRSTPAIPAYMIMDQQHRSRYVAAGVLPGKKLPADVAESGLIVQSNTLGGLAKQLEIDAFGLETTVERFNSMARRGVDEDFGRGDSEYDRFFGDPSSRYYPNPCLGTIEKAPFYACKIVPGDLGTKGGVLTDAKSRVLDKDGKVIPKLYAFGNTSASVMGRQYCGPGSTLGPSLTFAYLAINDIASSTG